MRGGEPVYQAIWVENDSFDEVLISPVMIQDHMPDKVLQALQKVGVPAWPAPRAPLRAVGPPLQDGLGSAADRAGLCRARHR